MVGLFDVLTGAGNAIGNGASGLFSTLGKASTGDNAADFWGSVGEVLSNGPNANIAPYLQSMDGANKQREFQKSLATDDMMAKFTPQERSFLAGIEPQLAQQYIAERLFAKPQAVKGVEVGGKLVDPSSGRVIYDGGPDQKALTDGAPSGYMWADPADRTKGVTPISGYTKAAEDEYGRYSAEEQAAGRQPLSRIDYAKAKSPSMSLETGPDGQIRLVQGTGADASLKPFTEGQSKDNVYVTRAQGALKALEPVAKSLTSRIERAAELDPTGIARGYQSDNFQVAKQAGDEFLQAILRKDTGAAITSDEQASYGKTYLPQPGDNDAVLAKKAQARARAIEAIKSGQSPAQILAVERALSNSGAPNGGSPNAQPKRRRWSPNGGLE